MDSSCLAMVVDLVDEINSTVFGLVFHSSTGI
jgi:hypothetical protein